MFLVLRIWACILVLGLCLYSYVDRSNAVTLLRMELPKLRAELRTLRQENDSYYLELERIKSPDRLWEWSRDPRFGHLHFPRGTEVGHSE
ncbi:MAG: hypothetical protein KDK78_02965 [Chlamydiia bacterium]|nr:hypothetical protein [Chlamydiia bacterium]